METEEEAFQVWWDGVSDSGPEMSSCSSDPSDLSVDSEAEHWRIEGRLSSQDEEEESAYLAGLIDEDVVHNDMVELFFSADGSEEGAGLMGPAPVTGAGAVA